MLPPHSRRSAAAHQLAYCVIVLLALSSLFLLAHATGPERYAGPRDDLEPGEDALVDDVDDDDGESRPQADSGRRGRRNREREARLATRPDPRLRAAGPEEEEDEDYSYYARTYELPGQEQQPEGGVVQPREEQGEEEGEQTGEYEPDFYPNVTDSIHDANCSMLDAIRAYKLEQFKLKILRKLRLKKPPKRPPGALPDILNYTNPDAWLPATQPSPPVPYDEDDSVTQKFLIMGRMPPHELGLQQMTMRFPLMMENLIYFQFADDLTHSKISMAQLGVFLRHAKSEDDAAQPTTAAPAETQLLVYRLERNHKNGRLVKHLLKKKTIRLDSSDTGTWHYLKFASEVNHWLKKPHENLGLEIQAQDGDGFPLAILQPEQGDPEYSKRPLLEVKIDEDDNSRSKRMVNTRLDCTDGKQSPYCCRYNMVANFDEEDYNFIIQPRQFATFFCAGDCPFYFQPANTHSHIARDALANEKDPRRPCCTGVRLAPLSMIYFDHSGIIRFGLLSDMIVKECACA